MQEERQYPALLRYLHKAMALAVALFGPAFGNCCSAPAVMGRGWEQSAP